MNLYYVVEKELCQLDPNINIEETTGDKTITVYEVSTELLELVVVTQIESLNYKVTELEIENWLKDNEYEDDYNLIKL